MGAYAALCAVNPSHQSIKQKKIKQFTEYLKHASHSKRHKTSPSWLQSVFY